MPTEVVVHSTFKRFLQVVGFAILFAGALTGLKRLANRNEVAAVQLQPRAAIARTAPAAVTKEGVIAGRSSVIDADTLEIHGVRIRLEGVDAPESNQRCGSVDQEWACGRDAAFALDNWIGGRTVSCRIVGIDRHQRKIARCFLGNADIQHWLVINGWALAYRTYSTDYVRDEELAAANKVGMWRGQFMAPWDWRKR
jgi:endonuclease YncB( thermonuclease family)